MILKDEVKQLDLFFKSTKTSKDGGGQVASQTQDFYPGDWSMCENKHHYVFPELKTEYPRCFVVELNQSNADWCDISL